MADDIKIVADYTDLQLMRRELVGVSKDAKTSASVFEREFSKVERQLARQEKEFRRNATASQSFYNQLLRVDKSVKSASASASVFEKQLNRVETATNRVTKAQMAATKANNNLGVVTQQAGYQVGDFIVQVQGGTNPFVAFGQQATQLVGILPLMTGLFGLSTVALIGLSAGLGVIIPLASAVGALFLNMSKNTDDATDSVKDLDSELTTLDDTLKQWVLTQRAAARGLTLDEMLSVDSVKEAEAAFSKAMSTYRTEIKTLSDGLDRMPLSPEGVIMGLLFGKEASKQEAAMLSALDKVMESANRLATLQQKQDKERFGNFSEEYSQLQDNLDLQKAIAEFGSDSAQVKDLQLQQAIDKYNKQVDAQVKANELTESQGSALKRVNEEAIRLEDSTNRAADAAKRFSDNLVLGKGFLDASVRAGVASGAIPASALDDLDQTDAEKAMEQILARRRRDARKEDRSSRGVSASTQADPLKTLQDRIALEQELLGKTEAQQRVIQALGVNWQDYSATALSGIFETIEEMDRLNQKAAEQEQISKTIESSMNTAFMSMVDGTKSVSDAFKDMARAIIADLYQIYVVKKITGMITGAIDGAMAGPVQGPMLPSANGNVFQGGSQVKAFADGGVVGGPTTFPMAGGRTGLMGEAGPEAIMPLKRGANGKLGVQMEGGTQGNVVVNQSFNFSANGDDSVKKLIAQAAPQIANMTQKQILDSRRRGGAMKSTFG